MFEELIQIVLDKRTQYSGNLQVIDNIIAKFSTQLPFHNIWQPYITSPGKRIRTILGLDIANKLRISSSKLFELLAIIELLHFGSLMHDDVLDQSTLRRGRPSIFDVLGPKLSILGGDLLMISLLQKIMSIPNAQMILQQFARACKFILRGAVLEQFLQIDATIGDYIRIAALKTGSLFALSGYCATLGANGKVHSHEMEKRCLCFGILFQIQNDIDEYKQKTWDTSEDFGQQLPTFPTILYPNFRFEYTPECFSSVQDFVHTAFFLKESSRMLEKVISRALLLME